MEKEEHFLMPPWEGAGDRSRLRGHGRLPAVEGVVARNDVGAVLACQELDAVVEGLHSWPLRLALLNDVQGVPGAPAERAVLTGRLQAAVGVQAVHQAIWRGRGRARVSGFHGTKPLGDANICHHHTFPRALNWQVSHSTPSAIATYMHGK